MYAILSGGTLIALCDKPRYVRLNPDSGCYVEAKAEEAIAVAVNGELYNLGGGNAIPDAPQAVVMEAEAGEVIFRNKENIQAVNMTSAIAFVTMAEKGDIDDVTIGEHTELFSPWACPVAYKTGDIRQYGGELYRCIQNHNSQADWTPDTAVSLWVKIADPAEEWPEWAQPVGAHDAYSTGDKVTHGGKHWISTTDGNVWEPGVYGWTEYVEHVSATAVKDGAQDAE